MEEMVINGSGNELSITWPITFKQAFGTKPCKQYLYVWDVFGVSCGSWQQKGTWTVGENHAPSAGTVTPDSGSCGHDVLQNFTTTYSDPNGWQNLTATMFLINDTLNGAEAFYAYYNQGANKVYLRNDENTGFLPGKTPGSAGETLSNSYVTLNVEQIVISGAGNDLSVTWPVTFKTAFGTKPCKQYLYVWDDFGVSCGSWQQKGTWSVGENHAPSAVAVTPSSGSSAHDVQQSFTTTYSDPDGWQNLTAAMFLINDTLNGTGAFYAYYNQGVNKVYLRNDANTGFMPGKTPSSAGETLSNSYVSIDMEEMVINGSGNELSITWPITFKPAFGTKSCKQYMYVWDDLGASCGSWQQKGTWSVTSP